MAPAVLDLAMYAGDTFSVTVTFTDDAGAVVDKTGSTYRAQVRRTAGSTSTLASFTVDDSDIADGVIVCTLAAGLVVASLDDAVWDLEETTGSVVSTKLAGRVTVTSDVSRS